MENPEITKANEEIAKLLDTVEPLVPELEAYTYFDPKLKMMLVKHPLVYSVPHHDAMNAVVNAQFRAKVEAVAAAEQKGEWGKYLALHEKPYRVEAFHHVKNKLGAFEYWELLSEVWVSLENVWQYQQVLKQLIFDPVPKDLLVSRHHMMSLDEQFVFNGLSGQIRIFRGCLKHNKKGLSWTLDREKAIWFANRFAKHAQPLLVSGYVDADKIAAYLDCRGEKEVILNPNHVEGWNVKKL
jgi:hypothetical protein